MVVNPSEHRMRVRKNVADELLREHARQMINWASHVFAGAIRCRDVHYPTKERLRNISGQGYDMAREAAAPIAVRLEQYPLGDIVELPELRAMMHELYQEFARMVLEQARGIAAGQGVARV